VGPAGRAWIEARLGWLLERFGAGPLEATVVTPAELYPDGFDGTPEAAEAIHDELRRRLGLADDHLRFELYDEVERPQGEWVGDGVVSGTAGHFVPAPAGEAQLARLNRKQLQDPTALVATLAHELGHVLLLGEGRAHLRGDEQDGEPLTDLCTIFFGFGLFNANSVITERSDATRWSVGRLGYLDQEHYAYALAVLARLRGEAAPPWATELRPDLAAWFAESQAFLASRDDLTPAALRRAAKAADGAFDDLWAQAALEEKTAEARVPWSCLLFMAVPVLIVLASIFGRPWLAARSRPLHVVNGAPWPATVRVAALGLSAEVPSGGRTALALGEGRHTVIVTTPLGEERVEAELSTGWVERLDGVRSAFVLDVAGAAALVERERTLLHWPGDGHGAVDAVLHAAADDPVAAAKLLEFAGPGAAAPLSVTVPRARRRSARRAPAAARRGPPAGWRSTVRDNATSSTPAQLGRGHDLDDPSAVRPRLELDPQAATRRARPHTPPRRPARARCCSSVARSSGEAPRSVRLPPMWASPVAARARCSRPRPLATWRPPHSSTRSFGPWRSGASSSAGVASSRTPSARRIAAPWRQGARSWKRRRRGAGDGVTTGSSRTARNRAQEAEHLEDDADLLRHAHERDPAPARGEGRGVLLERAEVGVVDELQPRAVEDRRRPPLPEEPLVDRLVLAELVPVERAHELLDLADAVDLDGPDRGAHTPPTSPMRRTLREFWLPLATRSPPPM
jgi:hypothetical protein